MVDLSRSKLDRPRGHLIKTTDIQCDYCGLEKFVVEEPGSETPRWLRCRNCDQYYYVLFGMVCANVVKVTRASPTGTALSTLSREQIEEVLK